MILSVFIPTYNPNSARLSQTLIGLKNQKLLVEDWELLIIDNNSTINFAENIDLSWHPNAKIIVEPKQGLTFARLKGFEMAKGDIIIMVDDDNILDADYLKNCLSIFNKYPNMGAIGGNIEGEFEVSPPEWTKDFFSLLAIRNLGREILIEKGNSKKYPSSAPVGAGMGMRKSALSKYLAEINQQKELISDRSGTSLTLNGFDIGFFPQLTMKHIIPAGRLTQEYLGKLNEGIMQSWTSFLIKYKICPWKTFRKHTLQLRIFKAYLKYKPWKSPSNYVVFKGILGQLKSLSK
jgi:glycosyltransferase involved in cell wall biosynthesis